MAKKKRKRKAKHAKPRKTARETTAKKPTIDALDKKAKELEVQLDDTRKEILRNDAELRSKLSEKIRAENELNKLLRTSFSKEKTKLSRIKSGAARKQANLKQRIVSLERMNSIYTQKMKKISGAKKKQNVLKKQLELLEKQAGALGGHV